MVAILREQKRLGHDVAAIIPSLDGNIAAALAKEGIPCHATRIDILSIPGTVGRITALLGLVRLLRRLKPDVVHSHILNAVFPARIAAWLADVPRRFSGNVGPLSIESVVLRPLELGTVFCDTKTIASSSYTLDLFRRYGVPEQQLELIFYAVDQSGHDPALADPGRVRRELGIAEGTPVIGMVAYFYPPSASVALMGERWAGRALKGHDVLLRAARDVLASVPDAKFILVGRGWGPNGAQYEQELKELSRSLGVDHAVIFPGERTDVPDILAAFDISVHCSITDNLAGTVESLLMERPMVVSDIPGFADTILHEKTGLRVPVDDPSALAAGILRLLSDRPWATGLGQEGRRWMLERFTLKRSISDLEGLLGRTRGMAEEHYKLRRSLVRAALAPFRLLPIAREVRRVQAISRRQRMRMRFWQLKKGIRDRVMSRDTPADSPVKLRIAQVAGAWENCQWFVDLCQGLDSRGHEVIAFIDSRRGDLADRLSAAGIRHYKVAMTFATRFDRLRLPAYLIGLPLAAVQLARLLRRERIDIVHSHIFTSVVVARLAAAIAKVRHVSMIPGPRHLESPLTRNVDRLTWWLDDKTVAGCQYTLDLYQRVGANESRLECIYYGADETRFDPALADPARVRRDLGVPDETPLISLVAHFYPPMRGAQTPRDTMGLGVKGHHDFLAAARIIARLVPDARFVLAGFGVMERGEQYRQSLIAECRADHLLGDRVIFTGLHGDVPSLLAASDVAVQCSLIENLGGTIEALLMERPVVATRVGGMPESVRHNETGLLVPPADPEALAAAIMKLLRDRELGASLARAGRALMLERYTFARMVQEVDRLYGRLIPQRSELSQASEATA
jgi:glycosyltransferase involved in cell wall biosynthesis